MLKAAIYTRISIDHDGRQTATARQLEDCRTYIATRGWVELGVYEDPDVSAYKEKLIRPSFERLKADILAGHVDVVVGWKIDRLVRRATDFGILDDLCESVGARIVTVVEGIDTGTSAGRMVATMMTGMARAESENISLRVKRTHKALASQGKNPGGRRSFGFEERMTGVREAEAEVLREGARRVLAGETLSGICRDWNRRGIETARGNPWTVISLRATLRSHHIAGQRAHEGRVIPAQWPAIISAEDHARLLRSFDARTRGTPGPQPRVHYLGGLLLCWKCGAKMRGRPSGPNKMPAYECQGDPRTGRCGGAWRRAAALEEYIRDLIFVVVESGEFLATAGRNANAAEDAGPILRAIQEDERALEELAHDRYVSRLIGAAEFVSAHGELVARLEANRATFARMTPTEAGFDAMTLHRNVRVEWETQTVEWRHRLARWLIDDITVGPSPRGRVPFHPESIAVRWRE